MKKSFKNLCGCVGCLFFLMGCASSTEKESYENLELNTANMQDLIDAGKEQDSKKGAELKTELSGDETGSQKRLKKNANIYSKPDTNSTICGTASRGEEIKILKVSNSWCKVSYFGRVAYITSDKFDFTEDKDDSRNHQTSNNNRNPENTSTGNTSTGNTSTGNTSTGNTSIGNTSTGNTSTGNTSTGNTSTGDTSTGDTSTGDTSTGDTSTGDTGTGDTSTGDTSTEDTGTGDTTQEETTGGSAENIGQNENVADQGNGDVQIVEPNPISDGDNRESNSDVGMDSGEISE